MEPFERREHEIERRRLFKYFRNMKRDYSKMKSAFELDLRQQQRNIYCLEREGHTLNTEYTNMYSLSAKKADKQVVVKLQKLSAQKKRIEASIQIYQKRLIQLRKETDEIHMFIFREKKSMFGPSPFLLDRKIRITEGTLGGHVIIFGKVNYENFRLRSVIRNLLVRGTIYRNIYAKVELIISILRQECKDIVITATAAQQTCEDIKGKCRIRCENEDKEQHMFRNKVEELRREMDYDDKRMEFFKVTNVDRCGPAAEIKQARYKACASAKFESYKKTLGDYNSIWSKVQEMSGSKRVDKAINRYCVADMHNFSLMTFTTVQDGQIAAMEVEIARLKKTSTQHSNKLTGSLTSQKDHIHKIEVQLQINERIAGILEEAEKKIWKFLYDICSRIKDFCRNCKLDTRLLLNPYYRDAGIEGVRALNCIEYMRLLEAKIVDHFNSHDFHNFKRLNEEKQFRLVVTSRQLKERKTVNTITEERRTMQHTLIRVPRTSILHAMDDEHVEIANLETLRKEIGERVLAEESVVEKRKGSLAATMWVAHHHLSK